MRRSRKPASACSGCEDAVTTRPFAAVLVANRGEIACRIVRTARARGMRTIAVYSEADRDALHVRLADEAHPIGPAPAAESYLVAERILAAARASGADCIHPGYGFLSERPDFAEACAAAGLVFVGPPALAIRAMGLKDAAKRLVEGAGVPVVPGYHGDRQEPDFLRERAGEIGYPVLIKAVAGGGGKGMRRVDAPADFAAALESARREAQGAFGDPRVLVEKYVLAPRHVEIQVFADRHGNAVSLFERDCSLQRRHQKVIEEAPAPGMPPEMRARMGRAATDAAKAVGYVGAGTVEFIADGRDGLRPDRFYFMEMNTRLQVEHPVTEAITGLDLVDLQFRVASGEPLPFGEGDLAIDGHAVEARLYAEDPANGFLPSTGRLWAFRPPSGDGVRVDTGVREGDAVTPFYDPMIAKVIAHGATRDEALDRLSAALGDTLVAGPRTNTAFLRALCDAPGFRAGAFDTGFIERTFGPAPKPDRDAGALAAAVLRLTGLDAGPSDASPWAAGDAFQLGDARTQIVPVTVDGVREAVRLSWDAEGRPAVDGLAAPAGVTLVAAPDGVFALAGGGQTHVALFDPFDVDLEHLDGGDVVKAPMHGKVVALFAGPGDRVAKGQRLAIVEAMKMEHQLLAPADGTVGAVLVEAGAQVAEGAKLITLVTEAADA
ncbi:acetyl/propionyl/methylcrotonyl-CoA carboxylase subunit alpha [Methylobacterium sp. NEAU 140]|uniref:acetyl/propionyl/methylcrotonyl-CoA carboxylase subunit alpha n=1 Tax=Methylobacterium sp. NEAU 140 TaxID=3064945 RepID=UPI0027354B51|nr:acetyl/propionyl/methylcrotonyl-CoA carboxylase subunit alpha [Methylobacterium sp. NEAU 140]MDP4021036.1 acetyl/propionyl/methylcrotonyl-CoA carboxylase subunit alpha [Methylobacterium sp. NEAU 140]